MISQDQSLTRLNSLIRIIGKIRLSLDFSEICQTAVNEARTLLNADRVAIYRFNPDWSGDFLYESAGSEWTSLVDAQHNDPLISKNVSSCSVKLLDTAKASDSHLQQTQGGVFATGELFRICPDIYTAGFSNCYIQVLESYQARSYAIIAIYVERSLWGLLAAYQNSEPRQWQEDEVEILIHIAEQLGVALKQSEYVRTIQEQSETLNQTLKDLQQSQAQLIQGEKMASLGQLVAGVAHEINNPVNFIYGNLPHIGDNVGDLLNLAQACRQAAPQSSDVQALLEQNLDIADLDFIAEDLPKMLQSMKVGADRIRGIVLSLRTFSRVDEAEFKSVNIHEGIDSTLLILGHRLKASDVRQKINIVKSYDELPLVECYPAQLNQVLMNLLTNAVDALDDAREHGKYDSDSEQLPTIWINTRQIDDQIEIQIRDNGTGIADAHLSKLFDYFFTTKPVGKGTGLGLAISKQIITEKHCGLLEVGACAEDGATFTIQIPIHL